MRELVVVGQNLDDRDNFVGLVSPQNLTSNLVDSETNIIAFDGGNFVPSSIPSPVPSDVPNLSVHTHVQNLSFRSKGCNILMVDGFSSPDLGNKNTGKGILPTPVDAKLVSSIPNCQRKIGDKGDFLVLNPLGGMV